MAKSDDALKETLNKKSLLEIESMILTRKKMLGEEKDLIKLSRLNTELGILKELRDKKAIAGGRHVLKNSTTTKPELKSYDDYIKSKR